jgi:hypothetical protein
MRAPRRAWGAAASRAAASALLILAAATHAAAVRVAASEVVPTTEVPILMHDVTVKGTRCVARGHTLRTLRAARKRKRTPQGKARNPRSRSRVVRATLTHAPPHPRTHTHTRNTGDDVYMACSTALPSDSRHIVRFEPRADMGTVHHMLLYLCPGEPLVRAKTGWAHCVDASGARAAAAARARVGKHTPRRVRTHCEP